MKTWGMIVWCQLMELTSEFRSIAGDFTPKNLGAQAFSMRLLFQLSMEA